MIFKINLHNIMLSVYHVHVYNIKNNKNLSVYLWTSSIYLYYKIISLTMNRSWVHHAKNRYTNNLNFKVFGSIFTTALSQDKYLTFAFLKVTIRFVFGHGHVLEGNYLIYSIFGTIHYQFWEHIDENLKSARL